MVAPLTSLTKRESGSHDADPCCIWLVCLVPDSPMKQVDFRGSHHTFRFEAEFLLETIIMALVLPNAPVHPGER